MSVDLKSVPVCELEDELARRKAIAKTQMHSDQAILRAIVLDELNDKPSGEAVLRALKAHCNETDIDRFVNGDAYRYFVSIYITRICDEADGE